MVNITPMPMATSLTEIGAKSLPKSRVQACKCLMKVDANDERVGHAKYLDVENRERLRRAGKQAANHLVGQLRVAMLMAVSMVTEGHKVHEEHAGDVHESHNEHEWVFTYSFGMMRSLALTGALLGHVHGGLGEAHDFRAWPWGLQRVAVKLELAWALTRRDLLEVQEGLHR